MSKQPILEINNLHAGVENKQILKGFSLTINAGEVHALMGLNGSGKSTLAAILAGRDGYEVTEGTVNYLGKDLLELDPEERARAINSTWLESFLTMKSLHFSSRAAFRRSHSLRADTSMLSLRFTSTLPYILGIYSLLSRPLQTYPSSSRISLGHAH